VKFLRTVIIIGIVLAGSIGAYLGGEMLGRMAYADGIASVDAGPAPPNASARPDSAAPNAAGSLASDTPTPVPDPVAAPVETAGEVHRLWKSGAILPAIIVALWALLLLARKWVPWLSAGKRAVYLGIAVTFVGAFVERAAAGSTPTLGMLLAAAATAVGAVMSPTGAAAK
jgi:hypothetical protein